MFIISKKFPLHRDDGCGEFIGSWFEEKKKKKRAHYGVTSNVRNSLERNEQRTS